MQEKSSLEAWYKLADPWGYWDNPDDITRKQIILQALNPREFERALDIGAGEGFITEALPAKETHAIEWADNAAKRLPKEVKRVEEPDGMYDLVVATGVLYPQYKHHLMRRWIKECASKTILTCHIKEWEIPLKGFKQTHEEEFKYREYTQVLRVYDASVT